MPQAQEASAETAAARFMLPAALLTQVVDLPVEILPILQAAQVEQLGTCRQADNTTDLASRHTNRLMLNSHIHHTIHAPPTLVDLSPETVLEPLLGLLEGLGVAEGVQVGQHTHHLGEAVHLRAGQGGGRARSCWASRHAGTQAGKRFRVAGRSAFRQVGAGGSTTPITALRYPAMQEMPQAWDACCACCAQAALAH